MCIRFEQDGLIRSYAGANERRGAYKLRRGRLTYGPPGISAPTLVLWPKTIMKLDLQLSGALARTAAARLDEQGRLILESAEGEVLLVGTRHVDAPDVDP